MFLVPDSYNKMPDVDSYDSSSGIAVDVQQRLNCALSVVSLSLDFFRYRGLHGMSADFSASLAVDLVRCDRSPNLDFSILESRRIALSP